MGFFFSSLLAEGKFWSRSDVGTWELLSRRPAADRQTCLCILMGLLSTELALQASQGLTRALLLLLLLPFTPPPFIPLFMALMVLNNLYVSECTAPSVHVGRAREQLGQSGRITRFHPGLKAAGYLASTCSLYSPQTFTVRFSKRTKASGVIKALRERTLYLSVV